LKVASPFQLDRRDRRGDVRSLATSADPKHIAFLRPTALEKQTMKNKRASLVAVALAGVIAAPLAFAETSAPDKNPVPPFSTSKPSDPSAVKQVESWTEKEWAEAVKEWSNDKAKWADCSAKSDAQKLSGRKSWSFLDQCMTD
jgi:hypothetical protein